jgi:GT2 family glycosyltransferase
MQAAPLVSVVVPTYNRAHLIHHAIDSVLAQSYDHIEVVVVDDGSTDGTRERIERGYGSDSRVRYVHKQNGGAASARNVGFRCARGDYIALLDSDDTWAPWKLAAQIGCMEQNRELGMTWTDMELIDPTGRVVEPAYLRKMYSAYRRFTNEQLFSNQFRLSAIVPELGPALADARLRTGTIFSHMVMGSLVHTSTVVLTRKRLSRVGEFDETLHHAGEDYDFHLRTTREGPVGLLDVPAIRYQQGLPDQLTAARYGIFMAENMLRTLERTVARDRAAIRLPESTIRHKFAAVHAWVAYERLERGETALAREHYIKSLSYRSWQPLVAKPLFYAALPFGAGVGLRRLLRRFGTQRSRMGEMADAASG